MADDLRDRLAAHPMLDELTNRQLDVIVEVVRAPVAKGERREPEPGQVWREKARQYNKRTVVVLGEIDGTYSPPGRAGRCSTRFIQVRTLTNYQGGPVDGASTTRVRIDNWHKAYEYDREEP
jgi:hypothetical protein